MPWDGARLLGNWSADVIEWPDDAEDRINRELYDHRGDLGDGRAFDDFENENLANSTEAGLAAARAELRAVLRAQFQHDDR